MKVTREVIETVESIIKTLTGMPKDKYEETVNALREESGKRAGALMEFVNALEYVAEIERGRKYNN